MIQLELYEFKNILMQMAELGAATYAKRIGAAEDLISQRQAYREFTQALVDDWYSRGMLHTTRSGSAKNSKLLYSRAELLACSTSERVGGCIMANHLKNK